VGDGDEAPEDTAAETYADGMARYFGELARRGDDDALGELRQLLRVRDAGTYDKHIVPRLTARALLRRGQQGVAELMAALPVAPGTIYPNVIIEAIWFAARGQHARDVFGVAERSAELTVPLDAETSAAAVRALRDLFAESRVNNELFIRLLDFVHGLWMRTTVPDDDVANEARLLFAEATIRLTPTLLDRFRELVDQELREEEYQVFLRDNPVLLDPLAAEAVPKQRLGIERVTDFALKRVDGRWTLVEIEKPQDKLFTLGNDFTAEFTHAFGQVLDFQRWVEDHGEYARSLMPGIASPAGLLVMGRRDSLDDENQGKLMRFVDNSRRIEVMTFDDVLASSESLYKNLYYRS
jgi:hypothetical protein